MRICINFIYEFLKFRWRVPLIFKRYQGRHQYLSYGKQKVWKSFGGFCLHLFFPTLNPFFVESRGKHEYTRPPFSDASERNQSFLWPKIADYSFFLISQTKIWKYNADLKYFVFTSNAFAKNTHTKFSVCFVHRLFKIMHFFRKKMSGNIWRLD